MIYRNRVPEASGFYFCSMPSHPEQHLLAYLDLDGLSPLLSLYDDPASPEPLAKCLDGDDWVSRRRYARTEKYVIDAFIGPLFCPVDEPLIEMPIECCEAIPAGACPVAVSVVLPQGRFIEFGFLRNDHAERLLSTFACGGTEDVAR